MAITLTVVAGKPLVQLQDCRGEVHDYLVEPLPVEADGTLVFLVGRYPSEEGDHCYRVAIHGRAVSCTCGDWRYRKSKLPLGDPLRTCKHLSAAQELRRLLAALAG